MPTKTKNTSRGRPKKEFKLKDNDTKVKRSRGRPKKDKKIKETDSVNTRISKHKKDIKEISKKHEILHYDISNASFVNTKIEKEEKTTNWDRFALGLLIFSMLLFIFSLYKVFYLNSHEANNNKEKLYEIIEEQEYSFDMQNDEKENIVDKTEPQEKIVQQEIKKNIDPKIKLIENFYETFNNKIFAELDNFADYYLWKSNLFTLYYTQFWSENFLDHLTNNKVYLLNIKQDQTDPTKPNVYYYTYDLKYKLKEDNQLFHETWKVAILDNEDWLKMWSMRCLTTGCSKMPFFNPEIHGIK